jgi:hypothetical protein
MTALFRSVLIILSISWLSFTFDALCTSKSQWQLLWLLLRLQEWTNARLNESSYYHRLFRHCTVFGRQRVREKGRRSDCDDVILVSPLVMRPHQRNVWTKETRHPLRTAVNFTESLFNIGGNYEVLVFGRTWFFEMIIFRKCLFALTKRRWWYSYNKSQRDALFLIYLIKCYTLWNKFEK